MSDAAKILDLDDYLDLKPKALSGGQRQHVAMGRTIVRQTSAFCMDEPAVEPGRQAACVNTHPDRLVAAPPGVTTVYVTHDRVEAMTMGDRSRYSRTVCYSPIRLYERPANDFVAGFIGSPAMNIDTFPVINGRLRIISMDLPLPRPTLERLAEEDADKVTMGFRPESLELVGKDDGFPMQVGVVEELGSDAFANGTVECTGTDLAAGGARLAGKEIITRVDPRRPPAKGDTIYLKVREGDEHLFSPTTGERLPM